HVRCDRSEDQRVELWGHDRATRGEAVRGRPGWSGDDQRVRGVGREESAGDVHGEAHLPVPGQLFEDDVVEGDDVERNSPADVGWIPHVDVTTSYVVIMGPSPHLFCSANGFGLAAVHYETDTHSISPSAYGWSSSGWCGPPLGADVGSSAHRLVIARAAAKRS